MTAKKQTEPKAYRLSQIKLVSDIGMLLTKNHGVGSVMAHQLNAIIDAANIIVEQFGRAITLSKPNMGFTAWWNSDDTGTSSKAMARKLSSVVFNQTPYVHPDRIDDHPRDPQDFGRCVRMLDAVPEFRPRLSVVGDLSPVWRRYVEAWDELEAMYRDEFPTGKSPKLYERMNAIQEFGKAGAE